MQKFSGTVIKGFGRGTKLQIPTLNLTPRRAPEDLDFGVYAVQVLTPTGQFDGVLHYGPKPSFAEPISLEIHCFGLGKKLYGVRIFVEIKKRLRTIRKFQTAGALRAQIAKDIVAAKKALKKLNKL